MSKQLDHGPEHSPDFRIALQPGLGQDGEVIRIEDFFLKPAATPLMNDLSQRIDNMHSLYWDINKLLEEQQFGGVGRFARMLLTQNKGNIHGGMEGLRRREVTRMIGDNPSIHKVTECIGLDHSLGMVDRDDSNYHLIDGLLRNIARYQMLRGEYDPHDEAWEIRSNKIIHVTDGRKPDPPERTIPTQRSQ